MLIRALAATALVLSGVSSAFAGTCDCKPEIKNASAEVSSSCSKIWSNNHCTLTEANNSTTQLRQRFETDLSLGVYLLEDALKQVFDYGYSDVFPPRRLAERFMSYNYIVNAEARCGSHASVEQTDLVMVLINPLLTFGADNSIHLLLEPQAISTLVDTVIELDVANRMCTFDWVERVDFSDGTFFFGAGCIGHGNSETYFATNLGGFSDCLQRINFW